MSNEHGRGSGRRDGKNGGSNSGERGGQRGQRQSQSRQERKPRTHISGARIVAYDVLRDVVDREAYANLALASRIREARLDGRDAALATELAAGTLRGLGKIDRVIELASFRKASEIDPRTLNVLRLGAHQLLSMRTATHAAVHESVELQRLVGNERAAGFVNGVLREITRSTPEEWDAKVVADATSPDDALAVTTSHPKWVIRALRDALRSEGREDELEVLLESDNIAPRVNLALLTGSGLSPDELEAVDPEAFEAVGASSIGLELSGGDPARAIRAAADVAGVPDGLLRVQDQGSQLAALALTSAKPVAAGERWLDLCAGPGGKTAVLGAEALVEHATIRANEVSGHRAELVENAVDGVMRVADGAPVVEIVSHDGRSEEAFGCGARDHELYDRILVDAPCSGLGALRRRPEARWRKTPSDLPELTELQGQLLDAAATHLKPGGVLAYVTCSPHLAETRVVVDRLLKRTPDLLELDAKAAVRAVARDDLDLPGERLSAQLWPHRHGTDAMFIALFERA